MASLASPILSSGTIDLMINYLNSFEVQANMEGQLSTTNIPEHCCQQTLLELSMLCSSQPVVNGVHYLAFVKPDADICPS